MRGPPGRIGPSSVWPPSSSPSSFLSPPSFGDPAEKRKETISQWPPVVPGRALRNCFSNTSGSMCGDCLWLWLVPLSMFDSSWKE